jgi:hypothetical protein
MAGASAYTRVLEPSGSVCRGLPDLAGADGIRLVLRSGEPVGPPLGARRYDGRWRNGRFGGDAGILVMPLATWGSEVHVSIRSPGSLAGRLIWRGKRLERLAAHLAIAIRRASERSRPAPAAQRRMRLEDTKAIAAITTAR